MTSQKQAKEPTPRELLIKEIVELKGRLLHITTAKGFAWGTAIRHSRGLPWRPQPAISLGQSPWMMGKNGVIYVAAPDAEIYVAVHLPAMTEPRLKELRATLEETLAMYTGVR